MTQTTREKGRMGKGGIWEDKGNGVTQKTGGKFNGKMKQWSLLA